MTMPGLRGLPEGVSGFGIEAVDYALQVPGRTSSAAAEASSSGEAAGLDVVTRLEDSLPGGVDRRLLVGAAALAGGAWYFGRGS